MSDSDSNTQFSKKIIQNKELINMVRERKCLWDRSIAEYKDRVIKDKAWTEIYRELDPSYDTLNYEQKNQIGGYITRKWYNIRDSYVKSMRSTRSRNRPYLYAESMKFLDATYLNEGGSKKRRIKTFNDERMSNEEEDNEYDGSATWMSEVFVDMDPNVESSDVPAKIPKLEYSPTPKEGPEVEDNIVTVLANLIQKEEDEDRAFFKSITPAVKKLSEHSKFVFRIQVMKLLNTLKMREGKEGQLSSIPREGRRTRERDSHVDSETE